MKDRKILLKKGHVVSFLSKIDKKRDILISNGEITDISENMKIKEDYEVIDVSGKFVIPALFDIHTHLRTPGREDKETFLSGAKAALKGGFTRICCMPNTDPPIDNAGLIRFIIEQSKKDDIVDILPIGAITKKREGKELAEMYDMKLSGAVGFSDDGFPVMNSGVMRRALEYAGMLGLPIITHSEDMGLSKGGHMNEGYISTILGIKGIPKEAEASMISRDIELSKMTGGHLHIAHVSCKESVDLVREAKKEGVNVTCETCPHYFSLTDEAVLGFNTNAKVNPPLRNKEDVEAIIEGLCDGTIDVIASDHAPHAIQEKEMEFDKAPFGMIGLELSLSLTITKLVKPGILNWGKLIQLMSVNPAKVVNQPVYDISKGSQANLVVVDIKEWISNKESFYSLSYNTPFLNKSLLGVVDYVFSKGRLLLNNGEITAE